ncbi:hypothetical protein ABXN37_01510 [Piscinibacter sakaiensis]|uniref:Uncharacterized protein n=1 Tax=Piscinibacter sakaiensis TaxID=1547922 RepID=A0A0K8NUA2_PISS1|nr:hypothetical protein [Piscinibacter sakaiensis]GAP33844.1 hypothetical protein ISF6_1099 [Piscinibacter sakaiensis]
MSGEDSGTGSSGGRAVRKCKPCTGEILVTVERSDIKEMIAGAQVDLKGPTPGAKTTDATGWAEFKGLTPGSYTFTVTIPKKDWTLLPYGGGLSVSADALSLGNAKAHPTGTLIVRVIDELSGALVQRARISGTEGPQSISWDGSAGSHDFLKVLPGRYVVTASGDDALYDAVDPTRLGVGTVPEGGSVTVTIPLPPKSWVAFVVHDKVANADLASVEIKARTAVQPELKGSTDGKSPCRIALRKRPATCKLLELRTADEDTLYEVVDVQSA